MISIVWLSEYGRARLFGQKQTQVLILPRLYLLHQLKRAPKKGEIPLGPKLFRDYRLWVACEADEDLPMLLNYIDENHIMIGSDYGHLDQSFEDNMVTKMESRQDVPGRIIDKILRENARGFYAF